MLNTTNSNSEYLHNYIRKVAKQEQESVDTSSVYTGTIEAAQSGIYTIVLNQSDKSSSVLAIPIVTGDIYDKDDSVYLLRANTTATVNYFIVGKVNAIQEAFFNLTELERFNPNESKADLSFGDNDFISISENINNIFDSINELGYFQLEVKIARKVGDDAKIIIYLNYAEDESQYAAKFEFSSYEFIGQPGEDNYNLIQKKIFHLPSSINITNIRIEKIGDFSVGEMNIVAGSLLEVSAAYQNSIAVQNDKNYFEKDIEIEDDYTLPNTVTLTSKVYYNNKPLAGDALQYYWLLKDDSAVNPESRDYVNIEGAGNGWRCLNTLTLATTADGEEIRLWDNKNNFITLNKKNFIVPDDPNEFVNFSNFVNKVKCIVKYFDNFIESDLIDIYNYDYEQFNAILQSTVDNNILAYKDDKIILQCEVLNDNEKIDNSKYSIEYRWYVKGGSADGSDLNITAKNEKDEEILTYSSLTIYDSAYTNTLQKGEYKLAKGKTEEEFYCVATIIPKGTKEGYHSEQTNVVKVSSNAAAADITQSIEYKYYISNEHNITFRQGIKQEEGQLSEWNGDWEINVAGAIWVGPPVEVDYNTVFLSFDIFNQCKKDEEQFVYYTQRNVWRERGEVFKTENWSFPQIARSVINVNGWKNHRVGDNVNQLNTFNQLSDNGKEDGIYYADIAKITTDDTPDWGTKYYERNVSPDGEISYTLISLEATIHFKKDEDYYTYNSEKEQYELVLSNVDYNKNNEYYKKINDNEYQKLVVNTQNFDITNVAWPSNKAGPFYTDIDNKLLINASYIRSGTLEVKDKFYASIDQDDVRIAGFNVDDTTFQSENGTVGFNSDNSYQNNVAIWAGDKFSVTHDGVLNATDAFISGVIQVGTDSNVYNKDEVYTKKETNDLIDEVAAATLVIGTGDYNGDSTGGQYAFLDADKAEFLLFDSQVDSNYEQVSSYTDFNFQTDYYISKNDDLFVPISNVAVDLNNLTNYYVRTDNSTNGNNGGKIIINSSNFKLDEFGNFKAKNGILSGDLFSGNFQCEPKIRTEIIEHERERTVEGETKNVKFYDISKTLTLTLAEIWSFDGIFFQGYGIRVYPNPDGYNYYTDISLNTAFDSNFINLEEITSIRGIIKVASSTQTISIFSKEDIADFKVMSNKKIRIFTNPLEGAYVDNQGYYYWRVISESSSFISAPTFNSATMTCTITQRYIEQEQREYFNGFDYSKINSGGVITFTDEPAIYFKNFTVDAEGNLTAKNGTFSGIIQSDNFKLDPTTSKKYTWEDNEAYSDSDGKKGIPFSLGEVSYTYLRNNVNEDMAMDLVEYFTLSEVTLDLSKEIEDFKNEDIDSITDIEVYLTYVKVQHINSGGSWNDRNTFETTSIYTNNSQYQYRTVSKELIFNNLECVYAGKDSRLGTSADGSLRATVNPVAFFIKYSFTINNKQKVTSGGIISFKDSPTLKFKDFEIDENGSVIAKSGTIGGFNLTDTQIFSENENLILNSDGSIIAKSGTIGPFALTNDGLQSDHIVLTSTSIYFPTQSVFNLSNDVSIFNEDSISYIATAGGRDFEIKNMGGAGIRFRADAENEKVTQTITFTGSVYEWTTGSGNKTKDNHRVQVSWSLPSGAVLLTPQTIDVYWMTNNGSTSNHKGCIKVNIPAFINSGIAYGTDVSTKKTTFNGISFTESNYSTSSISKKTIDINTKNNILYSLGSFCPNTTASSSSTGYLLGDDSHVWRTVRAYTASITTSDRREKDNIQILNTYHDHFFDKLTPVTFIYQHGDSGRTHLGFIAQDVEQALLEADLTTMDFAGVCIGNDENHTYGLRYEEFVALNTWQIQQLKTRIIKLENELKEIKGDK